MSINYTTYVSQIANLMVISSADANFNTMLPGMIDYAEQRMYRELDLQVSRVVDTSASLSSGVRNFNLPTSIGTYLVVEQINVWNSTSATSSNAVRVPLTPVAKEYIDFAWPTAQSSQTGVPIYFAPINNTTFIVGPAPNAAYPIEVIGTQRPASLSAANSSTFLTQVLPDLFIAASMVFGTGYMRDFGAQTDQPGMSQSWESQYKTLFASANAEELRKRFQSQGWTTMQPNQLASPPRS